MGRSRKKTSSITDERAMDDLTDLVVESFQPDHRQTLEPFEVYASRVRARVHSDIARFRKRFHHGYRVLLDELARQHPKKREQK